MIKRNKKTFCLALPWKTLLALLIFSNFSGCNTQSTKDTTKVIDTNPKINPESLHFIAHIIERNSDGSKTVIDTATGYRKNYYANGKLQMEDKVTKAMPKDYLEGIWKYYNEAGQLMKQETYIKEGKINELNFMYFTNGKPLSKTYQYYEGDYKEKSTFKFHKIETMFYMNGQELSERHWINSNLIDEKCWDSKGNSKPIEYLNTIKSLEVQE